MPQGAKRFRQEFDTSLLIKQTPITTAGGQLPDGRNFELIRDPKCESLKFTDFDGSQFRITDHFEIKGQRFVPAGLDPVLRRAMVLPTGAVDFGTVSDNFIEIRETVLKYGYSPEVATTVAFFTEATWFPERWSPPPCLILTGSAVEANQLLQLLRLMARHGMVLSSMGSVAFRASLQELYPTLLVDARYLSAGDLKTLEASCNPRVFQPWGNSLTESRFAKAIYVDDKIPGKFSPGFALSINISPAPPGAPMLDQADAENVAANLQPRLAGNRLRTLPKVLASDFDLPEVSSENRAIARLLGAAVTDAPELQAALRLLLEGCEEKNRDARWTNLDCVTLESLLAHCHKSGTERVYVGEIAEDVSAILKARGAPRKLTPRAVGAALSRLGFRRESDAKGKYLLFDKETVERIHRAARDHRVAALDDKVARCAACKELFRG